MIKKPDQFEKKLFQDFHGGRGEVEAYALFSEEEKTNPKIRMASKVVLQPGCSIGPHPHEKDEEIIYILEGVATVNDDGAEILAYPGDAAICGGGKNHGVANNGREPLVYLAFIITK